MNFIKGLFTDDSKILLNIVKYCQHLSDIKTRIKRTRVLGIINDTLKKKCIACVPSSIYTSHNILLLMVNIKYVKHILTITYHFDKCFEWVSI